MNHDAELRGQLHEARLKIQELMMCPRGLLVVMFILLAMVPLRRSVALVPRNNGACALGSRVLW